jgi:hypothetical protein
VATMRRNHTPQSGSKDLYVGDAVSVCIAYFMYTEQLVKFSFKGVDLYE